MQQKGGGEMGKGKLTLFNIIRFIMYEVKWELGGNTGVNVALFHTKLFREHEIIYYILIEDPICN